MRRRLWVSAPPNEALRETGGSKDHSDSALDIVGNSSGPGDLVAFQACLCLLLRLSSSCHPAFPTSQRSSLVILPILLALFPFSPSRFFSPPTITVNSNLGAPLDQLICDPIRQCSHSFVAMLALAPPVQHPPVECSHIATPPSASSSARPARPPSRRPSSYATANSSPSSSQSSQTTSSGRPSNRERPPSPRRAQANSANPVLPSSHFARDNEPPIPPPPNGSSTDPSHIHRGKQLEVDIHSYDPQQLLRLLASLLTQIATTNDHLSRRDSLPSSAFPSRMSGVSSGAHPPIWHSLTSASREALSSTSSLTFHARNIPSISLEAYLIRILKYCPASNEVFLSLLVYFDRMSKLAKEANGRLFVIDSYNIHRLVIAGVTVASKFFSDVFYTNSRYAKVCFRTSLACERFVYVDQYNRLVVSLRGNSISLSCNSFS